MELQLGCAKIDITPTKPIPLAGFAARNNEPFSDVRDPIYVRALLFRQLEQDGRHRYALVVSADLIWWGTDRMSDIRRTLEQRYGIPPERVVMNGTHSHSGPQTSFRFHRLLGQADEEYVSFLEQRLYEAVERARADLEPIRIATGKGECRIGINRRKAAGRGFKFVGLNPEGPIDHEVNVARFTTETGKTKAVLLPYACHPVITMDNAVSSEFPGAAAESLERELGEGAVCAFLQGCCGDINIYKALAGPELTNDRDIIRHFGNCLAQSVRDVLGGPMTGRKPVPLAGVSETIKLPLQPLPDMEQLSELAGKGESPYDEWAKEMIRSYPARPDRMTLELNRLDIADGLSLLAMNAEVVVEYGLHVKRASNGNVWPVPYSNGMIGYVPTDAQIREGGYEPDTSTYYFHMPSRFAEGIEPLIRDKLGGLAAVLPTSEGSE